jgi:peptidyl-prolyl cis-trans isomerase A (cyclophilin A)
MLKRFAALALPLALATAAFAQEQPATPPPADEPETVLVVLETTMGDITAAIETERAPITAANFLRYVDEGRFDGIVFYRAMPLDWGEQPNGLIQAGTQHDPERVLPPIAHEPTSQTGVKHVRGALSMARNAPGTATGDFSIMLQEQPGMDADPTSDDPELRAGYAAFGHVVAGMDVVEAIHAAPTDPDKGEGWMKGQMLADPVEIVEARRVEEN